MTTNTQIVFKALGRLGRKYQHHIYAVGTTLIVASAATPAYSFGLFDKAETALNCMFAGTSAGGTTNSLLSALPIVINSGITILLFLYVVTAGGKVISAIGEGQEITQVMQQPVIVFIVVLVLWIAQQILFNGITAC